MSKHCLFLLSFMVALCAACISVAQENDAGLWASINLEKKMNTKLSITLSEELRLNENLSEVGALFTEIGGNYKFNKHVSLGATYRFTQRRQVDDFYSIRHRYMIDLSLKQKFRKVGFNLRERFQSQYADIYSSEDGMIPTNYLRSKLTAKFDLDKKYTPYLSGELFYQLNNPKGNEIDNIRFVVGFEYKFNKMMMLDLFYMVNKEINVNNPLTNYVIGVGFYYTL